MHKNSAKKVFPVKKIVFLPECHSTNDYLLELTKDPDIPEGLMVAADFQTRGKGQRGNQWLSEPGKNLLLSILMKPDFLDGSQGFLLNKITSLALVRMLKIYLPHVEAEVKWPNDVFVEDRKIAGILIETQLARQRIELAVIGVGLNVNQSHFLLHSATSMKIECQQDLKREDVLKEFVRELDKAYLQLQKGDLTSLDAEYDSHLRWSGEKRRYRCEGREFEGIITGVDDKGKLMLIVDDKERRFDTKTIEFLY